MVDTGYWSPFFTNNKYPCYVRDLEKEEILYANEEFYQVFNCDKTIIGKKFHDVVYFEETSLMEIQQNVEEHRDYRTSFYHEGTNMHYNVFAHMIRDGKTVFCEFRILLEEHHSSELEMALTKCMDIYQQPKEEILPAFMKLLCEFYDCGRAYVHRFDFKKNVIHCISQWNTSILTKTDAQIATSDDATHIIAWIRANVSNGFLAADFKSDSVEPRIKEIFEPMHIQNLTLCTVEDVSKEIVGVVGISNRPYFNDHFDKRLMTTIARFVAQEVTQGVIDEKLTQLHYRDTLTGLFNRTGYAKRVDSVLGGKPKTLGVISANINGLKFVNEKYGISGGDDYIKRSAKRIKEHFKFEFFRMSGDEFIGIAPNTDKEAFEEMVFSLYACMKEEENFDFSIGHAWGEKNIDLPKLTFEAETIMYINKQEYYARSERKCDSINDSILSDLLSFLENEEFMVYLQPQVLLKDGSLHGAEALIRRFDKTNKKMIFPDQFIPMYEQNSVIRHVDLFVVDEVCRLLAEWYKEGTRIPISVNLSRVTLQEYNIVDIIVEICDRHQVPHELLVIEVTERVGLIENNVASSLITNFKKHGFSISLDDFGCAYSNIVTLAQIEVNEVKIDKSLVDNVLINRKNKVIVESLLSMCNKLDNTSTLAEGIEDKEQADLLHQLACTLGQGYFYSRPIPVSEFYDKYLK